VAQGCAVEVGAWKVAVLSATGWIPLDCVVLVKFAVPTILRGYVGLCAKRDAQELPTVTKSRDILMQMSANVMDTMMPRPLYPRFHRAINVSIISYPFPPSYLSMLSITVAISHCR
jgi:hypothetical protein